jgi:hypothetical protein
MYDVRRNRAFGSLESRTSFNLNHILFWLCNGHQSEAKSDIRQCLLTLLQVGPHWFQSAYTTPEGGKVRWSLQWPIMCIPL